MSYAYVIIAFAAFFILYKAAEGNYRNHIPMERNLLEANFEKRIFPEGRTEYFFHDQCANWFEIIFLERDVRSLKKEGIGLVSEYCHPDGRVIEINQEFEKKMNEYGKRLEEASSLGRDKLREVSKSAPFAYIRLYYKTKN